MLEFSRFKIAVILMVVVAGFYTAMPNFLSEDQHKSMAGFLPEATLNLGLDLQGGVDLLLEVDKQDIIDKRMLSVLGDGRQIFREKSEITPELAKMVAQERGRSTVDETVSNSRFIRSVRKVNDAVVFEVRKTKNPAYQDAYVDQVREIVRPLTQQAGFDAFGTQIEELELSVTGRTVRVTLTNLGVAKQQQETVSRTISVLKKRIDPSGTKEITIFGEGDSRIVLQIPGENDIERLKKLIQTAAQLSFHEVVDSVSQADIQSGTVPPGVEIVPMQEGGQIAIRSEIIVDGTDLNSAGASTDQNGRPAVSMDFNARGGKRFADYTTANVGRLFAIKLDGVVISAPRIQSAIITGNGQITNVGSVAEAVDLATLLSAGSLPVDISFASQNRVGPDLGADSIAAGKMASVYGFIGVIIFMIVAYGRFGIAANIGLIVNLILIMGALSLFQATLTLPGIAGIVLTIGMAVDANVLIFERIREEQRDGKKPYQAMESGYGQAMSTILDANITTFIAAAILYFLGSGPIQGFAVTLSVGILTSVFSAVVLTRLMLATWLKRTQPEKLPV